MIFGEYICVGIRWTLKQVSKIIENENTFSIFLKVFADLCKFDKQQIHPDIRYALWLFLSIPQHRAIFSDHICLDISLAFIWLIPFNRCVSPLTIEITFVSSSALLESTPNYKCWDEKSTIFHPVHSQLSDKSTCFFNSIFISLFQGMHSLKSRPFLIAAISSLTRMLYQVPKLKFNVISWFAKRSVFPFVQE